VVSKPEFHPGIPACVARLSYFFGQFFLAFWLLASALVSSTWNNDLEHFLPKPIRGCLSFTNNSLV
jgi:hypothetical protein